MFRSRKSKLFLKMKVKTLVIKNKNSKLKDLMKKEGYHPSDRDSTGMTLLHLAARYGNIHMMKYSITLGCDVDARDSSGATPLLLATKFNQYFAIALLLNNNADILATDLSGSYPLQDMLDVKRPHLHGAAIKMYYNQVTKMCSNIEEASEILLNAGCTLHHAAFMQDPQLTKILLEEIELFDVVISCRSVMISMFLVDVENLEALVRYGTQVTQRIEDFLWYLHDMPIRKTIQEKQEYFFGKSERLATMRTYMDKIKEWNILDEHNLKYLKYIYEDADKDMLKVVLESDVHTYVRQRFAYNLLAHSYGNRNAGIIELLQSMNLDAEAYASRDSRRGSALHVAAYSGMLENVKFLLSKGVDPNITDEYGETPLFCLLNPTQSPENIVECILVLLKNNADIEISDNSGNNFIRYVDHRNEDNLPFLEPVLAHLAFLEATGRHVKPSTIAYVEKHDELRNCYELCHWQIEEMKKRVLYGPFSLFTVIVGDPEKMARFVGAQKENILTTLRRSDDPLTLNKYYETLFREKLDRALRVNELRSKLDCFIREIIPHFNGYSTVIDNILSNFDFENLLTFNR